MSKIKNIDEFFKIQQNIIHQKKNCNKVRIMVHMGTCCIAAGALDVLETMQYELKALSLENNISVEPSGCIGLCYAEPTVSVLHPDGTYEVYGYVDSQQSRIILNRCRVQSPIKGIKQLKPKWKVINVLQGE